MSLGTNGMKRTPTIPVRTLNTQPLILPTQHASEAASVGRDRRTHSHRLHQHRILHVVIGVPPRTEHMRPLILVPERSYRTPRVRTQDAGGGAVGRHTLSSSGAKFAIPITLGYSFDAVAHLVHGDVAALAHDDAVAFDRVGVHTHAAHGIGYVGCGVLRE